MVKFSWLKTRKELKSANPTKPPDFSLFGKNGKRIKFRPTGINISRKTRKQVQPPNIGRKVQTFNIGPPNPNEKTQRKFSNIKLIPIEPNSSVQKYTNLQKKQLIYAQKAMKATQATQAFEKYKRGEKTNNFTRLFVTPKPNKLENDKILNSVRDLFSNSTKNSPVSSPASPPASSAYLPSSYRPQTSNPKEGPPPPPPSHPSRPLIFSKSVKSTDESSTYSPSPNTSVGGYYKKHNKSKTNNKSKKNLVNSKKNNKSKKL